MKIEVKQNKNGALFENIEAGVVFQYDVYYYIKVSATFRIDGAEYNAISLDDGEPTFFEDNDEIFIPSAKLVIE